MRTFLELVAKDMLERYGEDLEGVTVLFPNKRAGLFLAEALGRLVKRPVWMPKILTLGEFVGQHTGLRQAGELTLIIKLYKAYREASGTEERFDDFYFWGGMLLGDFDDVDKYRADARDLFSNVAALKDLEGRFPYLTEEQTEAVRRFWGSFRGERLSREQEEFLRVWERLHGTYEAFREGLQREGLCYEGMNERLFCEHIGEYEVPKQLVVAGFNALNRCEKEIFSHYEGLGVARFYWDYDVYYTSNEHQEAGAYMRENLQLFPNALEMGHFNNFLHNGKRIEYIAVPSAVGQAKLVGQLLPESAGETPQDTAVVLCDEGLLVPVLHSLPPFVSKVNVTMGYPAQKTAAAALVGLLCDLRKQAKGEGDRRYYYYKAVVALLNHKFVKGYCAKEIDELTEWIHRENVVYVDEEQLRFHPLAEWIFSKTELPEYLLNILDRLMREERQEEDIEKEFLFAIYAELRNLQDVFGKEGIRPEEKLYAQIIEKVIGGITIPFSGEPLEGLQLMGLMETRMLDFKHLVILSANEGTLPRTTMPSSFIPYNLRVGFRLPTPEHQDALFAYYFYRLLQRAKDVHVLYSEGTKGVNGGEMSRYLYQIKYESGLTVKERSLQNLISTPSPQEITIAKTGEVRETLAQYEKSAERLLSPSALNTYMECGLRFYFKYVAGIEEKEEVAEELDARLLGTIFHESSQSLYATVPKGLVTREAIEGLLADEKQMERHILDAYRKVYDVRISRLMESGNNELVLNAVKKYIRQMLEYDKRVAPFRMVAMETRFHVPVEVEIGGAVHRVYIGGFIDRVDQTDEGIRIIDYKTGSDTTDFKDIASVFDTENPTRNKAAFQTMLYCLMYDHERPGTLPLIPGIYNTKLLFGKDYDYHLICEKTPMADFRRFEGEYVESLRRLLVRLFSPDEPFRQTEDEKKCPNCPYAGICRR